MNTVSHVIVPRLVSHYDPLWGLGFLPPGGELSLKMEGRSPRPSLREVEASPSVAYRDSHRDLEYHLGRMAFFVAAFREGRSVDPVSVDNLCDGGRIYPQAILIDGHHRLAAASLLGEPLLPATYGGLVSLLDWLTGKTDEEPC